MTPSNQYNFFMPRKLSRQVTARVMAQSFVEDNSNGAAAATHRHGKVSGGTSQIDLCSRLSKAVRFVLELLISECLKSILFSAFFSVFIIPFGSWSWNSRPYNLSESPMLSSMGNAILQGGPHEVPHFSTQDGNSMFNFASPNAGAYHLPAFTSNGSQQSPQLAFTSSLERDQCWLLPEPIGHIAISLQSPIVITHITLDHPSMIDASYLGDAPRWLIIWGLVEGRHSLQQYHAHPHLRGLSYSQPAPTVVEQLKRMDATAMFVELGNFQFRYTDGASHRQTFSVHQDVVATGLDFGILLLEIKGNWGANRTCLCSFEVHGRITGE